MNEAPGPINFTMFLTMFGEKLNGTDPEDVIKNAFACFDEDGTGTPELIDVVVTYQAPGTTCASMTLGCLHQTNSKLELCG